jgi:hypothetical protein
MNRFVRESELAEVTELVWCRVAQAFLLRWYRTMFATHVLSKVKNVYTR